MLYKRTQVLLFLLAALFLAAGVPAAQADGGGSSPAARTDMTPSPDCWQCHRNDAHAGAKDVGCDSCHKTDDLVPKDAHEEKGRTACNYKTYIPIGKLPKAKQSAICLRCHGFGGEFTLQNWNSSAHNINGVSCIDCHNIHHGGDLKPHRPSVNELCGGCHEDVMASFMLPEHHPLREGKMTCIDCHDPHGSPNPGHMLKRETVKETCTRCHAEKEGPFMFEHADLMEDCTICHVPHGSQNDWLLQVRQPFLCKQCHSPDHVDTDRQFGATNCTNCHSQIHGTDLDSQPIAPGEGFFFR